MRSKGLHLLCSLETQAFISAATEKQEVLNNLHNCTAALWKCRACCMKRFFPHLDVPSQLAEVSLTAWRCHIRQPKSHTRDSALQEEALGTAALAHVTSSSTSLCTRIEAALLFAAQNRSPQGYRCLQQVSLKHWHLKES